VAQQARIADVADEPLKLMGPMTGVMKCKPLSLMDAVAASRVKDMDAHAFMASEAGAQLAKADPHGLDADEAGALVHGRERLLPEDQPAAAHTPPPSSPSSHTCS
jgi:hypothetical protein